MKDLKKDSDYTRCHDLTVEEVKRCLSFKDFTDAQAQEVIETLKQFTKITYHLHKKYPKKLD